MGFETDLDVIFALAHLPIHRLCQFVNQTAEGMFHDQDPPIRLPVTDCKEWVTFFVPHVSLGAAVIALFAVYTCHYLLYVVRPPRVVCSDLAKVKWLEAHCPVFFERYWPTAWAPQAHMQTILRAVVQMRHALKLHRRRLGERISHTCNRLNYYVPKLPPPTPSHHVGVRFLKRISCSCTLLPLLNTIRLLTLHPCALLLQQSMYGVQSTSIVRCALLLLVHNVILHVLRGRIYSISLHHYACANR